MIRSVQYTRAVIVQLNTGNILDINAPSIEASGTLESDEERSAAVDGTDVPISRQRTVSIRVGDEEQIRLAEAMAAIGCPCYVYFLGPSTGSQMAVYEEMRLSVVADDRAPGFATHTIELSTYAFNPRLSDESNLWTGLPWVGSYLHLLSTNDDLQALDGGQTFGTLDGSVSPFVTTGPDRGYIIWDDGGTGGDTSDDQLQGTDFLTTDIAATDDRPLTSIAYDRTTEDAYIVLTDTTDGPFIARVLEGSGFEVSASDLLDDATEIEIDYEGRLWTRRDSDDTLRRYDGDPFTPESQTADATYTLADDLWSIGPDGRVWALDSSTLTVYADDGGTLSAVLTYTLATAIGGAASDMHWTQRGLTVVYDNGTAPTVIYTHGLSNDAGGLEATGPRVLVSTDEATPRIDGSFDGAFQWTHEAPLGGARLTSNAAEWRVIDVDGLTVAEADDGEATVYPDLGWQIQAEGALVDTSPFLEVTRPGKALGPRAGGTSRDCATFTRPAWAPTQPLVIDLAQGAGSQIDGSVRLEDETATLSQEVDTIQLYTTDGQLVDSADGGYLAWDFPESQFQTDYVLRIFPKDERLPFRDVDRLALATAGTTASFDNTDFSLLPSAAKVVAADDDNANVTSLTMAYDPDPESNGSSRVGIPLAADQSTEYDLVVRFVDPVTDTELQRQRVTGQVSETVQGSGVAFIEAFPIDPTQAMRVKVAGTMPKLAFADQQYPSGETPIAQKLVAVEEWSDLQWTDYETAFFGCSNLLTTGAMVSDVTGAPSVTGTLSEYLPAPVGSMVQMFRGCTSYAPASDTSCQIGDWDVSAMTALGAPEGGFVRLGCFQGCTVFNQNIGGWDTSSMTQMQGVFADTDSFNQDLAAWDVSGLSSLSNVFRSALAFQNGAQPLDNTHPTESGWDVSSVTTADLMFISCVFNQDIGAWDVSSLQDATSMFQNCSFNQDIASWNPTSLEVADSMFENSDFDQPLNAWGSDTSSLVSAVNMFSRSLFNQDISAWDVSSLQGAANMLGEVDQDISAWDVNAVTRFDASSDFGFFATALSATNADAILSSWAGKVSATPDRITLGTDLDDDVGGALSQSSIDAMCAAGVEVYTIDSATDDPILLSSATCP